MFRTFFLFALISLANQGYSLESSSGVDVKSLLQTGQSWDKKTLTYPQGPLEVTSLLIEIAPNAETGWHLHPVPSFAYVLEGELEVRLKDGTSKRFHAGDAFAEVVNTAHNGKNIGPKPVKLVVFYTATSGQTLTQKLQ